MGIPYIQTIYTRVAVSKKEKAMKAECAEKREGRSP